MVVAVEEFTSKYPNNEAKIAFLLTSDEEGVATDGTIRIVEHIKNETDLTIDYCVVGEPSSKDNLGDTIRIGRRGSLNAVLRVKGIEGHVAYPNEAKNPIHHALPALDELIKCRQGMMNRIFCLIRVRDMPFDSFYPQYSIKRTSPTNSDSIA